MEAHVDRLMCGSGVVVEKVVGIVAKRRAVWIAG